MYFKKLYSFILKKSSIIDYKFLKKEYFDYSLCVRANYTNNSTDLNSYNKDYYFNVEDPKDFYDLMDYKSSLPDRIIKTINIIRVSRLVRIVKIYKNYNLWMHQNELEEKLKKEKKKSANINKNLAGKLNNEINKNGK